MAKTRCFICNRKIHPKDGLKRDNRTFGNQVILCSEECYEQDRILDERCEEKSEEEMKRYIKAVNYHFPGVEVQYATCLDCRSYRDDDCEGFLKDPLDCMEEKAEKIDFEDRVENRTKKRW